MEIRASIAELLVSGCKRKLAKPETATLKDKGIPKKISDELEGLLAFMQGGSLQNSRIRMDRTFQDKIEHETKQLKKEVWQDNFILQI